MDDRQSRLSRVERMVRTLVKIHPPTAQISGQPLLILYLDIDFNLNLLPRMDQQHHLPRSTILKSTTGPRMPSNNKRKSMSSPSPEPAVQPKRRHGVRNAGDTAAAPVSAYVPQPLINTIPRPKRWRTSHNMNVIQNVRQSIYEPDSEESTQTSVTQHEGQARTELRFSFAQTTDEHRSSAPKTKRRNVFGEQATKDKRPDNALSNSFSNLSFDRASALQASASAQARQPASRPNSVAHPSVPIAPQNTPRQQAPNHPSVPFVPDLTKPKREGYGFSFSDTIFQDSMEYPDTECDWGSETERDSPNGHDSGFEDAPSTPTGSRPLTAIANDTSFDDVVVMRDVGSFHLARPQKRLSCTTATREDTLLVKIAAKKLLKYDESASIYAELVSRLERMVHASLHLPDDNGYITTGTSATACALKLQDHLLRSKSSRIMTGEVRLLVEHEIEWATWLVEASRTGVMHLKAKGCKCRPDWEEEE